MKFQQLKIGQQFEYQGNRYVKSSPLVASHAETGEQKLIPRYATIVVMDTAPPPENNTITRMLNSDQVRTAFDKFYTCVIESLETSVTEIDAQTIKSMHNQLENSRQEFLNELGLSGQAGTAL